MQLKVSGAVQLRARKISYISARIFLLYFCALGYLLANVVGFKIIAIGDLNSALLISKKLVATSTGAWLTNLGLTQKPNPLPIVGEGGRALARPGEG